MNIYDQLLTVVKKKLKGKEVDENSNLKDLGLDSLDRVDILIDLESLFDIEFENEEMQSIVTVKDLHDCIEGKISKK